MGFGHFSALASVTSLISFSSPIILYQVLDVFYCRMGVGRKQMCKNENYEIVTKEGASTDFSLSLPLSLPDHHPSNLPNPKEHIKNSLHRYFILDT
jgi:hypothetical protein